MYHIDQLKGFATTIESTETRTQFLTAVDTLRFDVHGLCLGQEVQNLDAAGLRQLREDFESRHTEFITASVIAALTGVVNPHAAGSESSSDEEGSDVQPRETDNGVSEAE